MSSGFRAERKSDRGLRGGDRRRRRVLSGGNDRWVRRRKKRERAIGGVSCSGDLFLFDEFVCLLEVFLHFLHDGLGFLFAFPGAAASAVCGLSELLEGLQLLANELLVPLEDNDAVELHELWRHLDLSSKRRHERINRFSRRRRRR